MVGIIIYKMVYYVECNPIEYGCKTTYLRGETVLRYVVQCLLITVFLILEKRRTIFVIDKISPI